MNEPLRIALIVPTDAWYDRVLIDGITTYSREHGPWRLVLQTDNSHHRVEPWLQRWKPDGILARITGAAMAARVRRLGIPVVDLLEESGASGIPRIVCDDRGVVQAAVDHLLDCRFQHLAYAGSCDHHFSRRRLECFRDCFHLRAQAAKRGDGMQLTSAEILSRWEPSPRLRSELAGWLHGLPKPVGIVACNDFWGSEILQVCQEFDLDVPNEIAVIGIDDDPVISQLCMPPLSSVGVNARAIGYRAAAMLHGMITRGESPPPETFVEPGPVRPRASTDTLAIPDADVAATVRFVRDQACERLTIAKVAAKLGVSPRTLKRKFTRHLGHSPTVEIIRSRLRRARELLVATDLPLPDVARRTGFLHTETLHRAFKKHTGVTPCEYRRVHRLNFQPPSRSATQRAGARRRDRGRNPTGTIPQQRPLR